LPCSINQQACALYQYTGLLVFIFTDDYALVCVVSSFSCTDVI
jgi:hypothetical protein